MHKYNQLAIYYDIWCIFVIAADLWLYLYEDNL